LTQGEWQGVPDRWSVGREGAGAEGGEFAARDVQAERVRGGSKRARRSVEVERVGEVDGSRVVDRLVAEGQDLVLNA
jgi:hypothetical protein